MLIQIRSNLHYLAGARFRPISEVHGYETCHCFDKNPLKCSENLINCFRTYHTGVGRFTPRRAQRRYCIIVINALVVYMVRCGVIFMRETSILGALEGVGMKIETGCRPNGPSVARVSLAATSRDFHPHPF